jgi:hypothetical protein
MLTCGGITVQRIVANLKDGREGRYGAVNGEGSFEYHWTGCLGEMAVAKHFNLFWAGALGNFDAADVGGIIQVRARGRSDGQLILHPKDNDAAPFVLALAPHPPLILLCGWVYARDGKKPNFWKDPAGGRPAFFVPKDVLRPLEELETLLPTLLRPTQGEAA